MKPKPFSLTPPRGPRAKPDGVPMPKATKRQLAAARRKRVPCVDAEFEERQAARRAAMDKAASNA